MIPTTCIASQVNKRTRLRLTLRGTLQGVGFRPFVYRLAKQFSLGGWITNTPKGILLELEGFEWDLTAFQYCLKTQRPPAATIQEIETDTVPQQGTCDFTIQPNQHSGITESVIAPDLGICDDCVQEIKAPHSRRFRYPFTTCTQCGPRFSVVTGLPYDRHNTTMKIFPLCHDCQDEYEDTTDRRFHAETIACPQCGPYTSFLDQDGIRVSKYEEALMDACAAIRHGKVLAVKGIGGFQLWVNACSTDAIHKLRVRKHRPHKPLAVLFPSVLQLRDSCILSSGEEALLRSPAFPIVLLRKKPMPTLAANVAPNNPYVGAMLPYTPLHYLLMNELGHPVVATSGNLSDEPIIIDEQEAVSRLNGIADVFLIHNRPIARPIDDSVVRLTIDEQMMLRRARGYVPVPVTSRKDREDNLFSSVLAVGGQIKNTVAVTTQDQVLVSQHLGDLSTLESDIHFKQSIADHLRLFHVKPKAIACDLHQDYRSTLYAHRLSKQYHIPVIPVQHHHAHIVSCMAEHGLEGPVLGVAWDGSGYGSDGTLWGGELLRCDYSNFRRIAHLRPFRLPGGEVCMREPRRVALSLLYEAFGEETQQLELPPIQALGPELTANLISLLQKNIHCPITTSMGRLFDAISSILGLRHVSSFEGEAAMALEFSVHNRYDTSQDRPCRFPIVMEEIQENTWHIDWRPFLRAIVQDYLHGTSPAHLSENFHYYLVDIIERIVQIHPHDIIVLSGGVFQNLRLTSLATDRLQSAGHRVYTNVQFPANDGGLALGQALIAQTRLQTQQESDSQ